MAGVGRFLPDAMKVFTTVFVAFLGWSQAMAADAPVQVSPALELSGSG